MDKDGLKLKNSTSAMNYATHGFHRYYGKLPSEVYGHIFAAETQFTELMCGSGTGLVEGILRGKSAVGIDSSPLAVMLSKAKTTPLNPVKLKQKLSEVVERAQECMAPLRSQSTLLEFNGVSSELKQALEDKRTQTVLQETRERIPNFDHWFSELTAMRLALLKGMIEEINNQNIRRFFLVCFSSIIRRVSNASTRAGKMFHIGRENETDVLTAFEKKCQENIRGMQEFVSLVPKRIRCSVLQEDARHTSLGSEEEELVICHPPYFALYRYSAINSLELGWLGLDRSRARSLEIEEGYKTVDIRKYHSYLEDMTDVIREAHRVLADKGVLCLIVGDSSLRSTHLPVVDDIRERAVSVGFGVVRVIERTIEASQAVYHPSSKTGIRRETDCLLFLRKTHHS